MKKLLLIFIVLVSSLSIKAQNWFKPSDMVTTGVYYYPEAWNPEQWDRDFAHMAAMGFEFTHMGEFAWAQMEPEEGKYDFSWLDKAIELAAKHGLKVILCTPTATPPAWLTEKYPEVLVVNSSEQKAQHGTRQNYSWSSTKYRELTKEIVTKLAEHYGKDKRVMGWQIDNEPSHYGVVDYGPEVRARFINWLKDKYQNIDNLNKGWGTAFWSGIYQQFEQIELPNPNRLICGPASQHSILDFRRFTADECAGYVNFQSKILHSLIYKNQFVCTNYMGWHTDVDPRRSTDLDFPTYTMYLVAGYTDGMGDQGFRIGDPWRISFTNDLFRPIKGITGVMELQPGQVNWGSYNPQPYPGAIRTWLWNAFAGDLKLICSYRYRQPLFGNELYHNAMVQTDGITTSIGGKQYSQFMSEIKQLRKLYKPNSKIPDDYYARRTGFLFNNDNLWDEEEGKQTYQWNTLSHIVKYYMGVKSTCAPVDFVSEDQDFSRYKVLIAPAYQLVDMKLVTKWEKYVENGGNLILTCRTAQKDSNGHLWEMPWAGPILNLIGAKIDMFDMLPSNREAKVTADDRNYYWSSWAEILEANKGTEVWASYTDQFYAGKTAVTHRKLGKGTVTYIGVDTKDGSFEKQIIRKVYLSAQIDIGNLPEGVYKHWRDGFWIAVNYNSIKQTIDIPENAEIIFGTRELKPADVLVWR